MNNCKNVSNYLFGRGSVNRLVEFINSGKTKEKSTLVYVIDEYFSNSDIIPRLPIDKNDDIVIFD